LASRDQRAWLWVAVTSLVTVFLIRMSRGGQRSTRAVGEHFSGIFGHRPHSAYNWVSGAVASGMLAHLLAGLEAIRGRGGASEEIGEALLPRRTRCLGGGIGVRGDAARSTFRAYMRPAEPEVEHLLEAGSRCGVSATEGCSTRF